MIELNVSRETSDRLDVFVELVQKWTKSINLISKSSLPEIWERHIVDSAQLHELAPDSGHWVDIGSGGGFPAIVIAILSLDSGTRTMTLIESDQRKAVFLRTAIRELELNAKVIADRIENIESLNADILSARALADLTALLEHGERQMAPHGIALFPKGANWKNEVEDARNQWSFGVEHIKSKTNPKAAVLKVKDITRV
ncbi:MAG: 16S rRNA (guanine(527)-N(7))-methyltransferase RsmG [Sulfitobacter sp.]